jgi:hypothetical protein
MPEQNPYAGVMPDEMYRPLTPDEIGAFKEWTHHNWQETLPPNFSTYHPVVRSEWRRIDNEKHFFQCDICGRMVCQEIIHHINIYGSDTSACAVCLGHDTDDRDYDSAEIDQGLPR